MGFGQDLTSEKNLTFEFTQAQMFVEWSMGKVFALESPFQSGEFPHTHDYFQIWYVERGHCEHQIEEKLHKMDAGDVFILPPGITHQTTLEGDTRIMCVEFSLEPLISGSGTAYYRKLHEITQGMSFDFLFRQDLRGAQEKFTLSLATQTHIETLMKQMLVEYENKELLYEDFLQLMVLQLLLLLVREYALLPRDAMDGQSYATYRNLIASSIDYIDHHFDRPLTLETMCKYAAMSKTYFCYLFKMSTQKTFTEYLTDVRIQFASKQLAMTDSPITQVASESGFQDPSHFSRTFRKSTGMTPSNYRKKYRS